jgi:cell division protein FtsN
VAASDPVSFPTNLPTNAPVPSGNPEVPTDVNQLFAFLSQNIPPVDGAAGELNYTVVVPGTADSLLNQIQEIIPTAKVVSSRMGACIQVQAYRDRGRAESLTAMLRSVGFDARVLHQSGG